LRVGGGVTGCNSNLFRNNIITVDYTF
jgi:hypothetical protein